MYKVLKQFWYPTAPGIMRRVKAGENMPLKERRMVVANVGDVLDLSADIVRSVNGIDDGPYVEEVANGEA